MIKEEIAKKIQSMHSGYSVYQIFDDWIHMLALSISNCVDSVNAAVREEEYLAITKKYSNLEDFCQLNAMLIDAFDEGMDDVLGWVYMHLEISSSKLGQFFTPYHLCKLMADMQYESAKEILDKGEVLTINEPSCGAGGNIIAMCDILKSHGHNYQFDTKVVCQDLDFKGVYMCYVQLSLLGIPAIVVQGDTLRNPTFNEFGENTWVTPMYVRNRAIR